MDTNAQADKAIKDDVLRLTPEPVNTVPVSQRPWKLLVVDDEEEVHAVTHLALSGFEFASRPLEIISAYTGEEANRIMAEQDDIAMILLDVVMESDQAGLDTVKYIREELGNSFVRIILRTGQPGQAPEYQVITQYDINDYKHKTELTREKMFTLVYTSLSAYRDLMALEANRHGLEKVIEASSHIFELRSFEKFTQGVLEQLTALLFLDEDAVVIKSAALAAEPENNHLQIIAATGKYVSYIGQTAEDALEPKLIEMINQVRASGNNVFGDDYYIDFHRTHTGEEQIIYACGNHPISVPDRHLIDLFSRNVAIAHENVRLMSGTSHTN